MRRASTHLMASAAVILATVSYADEPQAPATETPGQEIREALNRPPREVLDEAAITGLPEASRPEVLTPERAYALALIRARAGRPDRGGGLAATLDPKTLAEQAKSHGVPDFDRFRNDFFAEGKFRDPSGAFLELLRRRQAIDNARMNVASHESLSKLLRELVQGEASGLDQLNLDRVEASLQEARRGLSDEVMRYHDALDEWKVELGLSPHSPVALDRAGLAAFRAAFEKASRWFADPNRRLEDLPGIAMQLPTPEDVTIDGRAILDAIDTHPDRLEELLSTASRVAIKDRSKGDADGRIELRVRRRIGHLVGAHRAYELERRRFVLILRQKDQSQEQLIAPPQAQGRPSVSEVLRDLLGHTDEILECENRLVALWTSFQAQRLALYRDLGTMPFSDWKSFQGQFTAKPGEVDPGPKDLQPAPPTPPPVR